MFNGDYVVKLARQHNMSEQQLYKIIRKMLAEQHARLQGKLDLGDSA